MLKIRVLTVFRGFTGFRGKRAEVVELSVDPAPCLCFDGLCIPAMCSNTVGTQMAAAKLPDGHLSFFILRHRSLRNYQNLFGKDQVLAILCRYLFYAAIKFIPTKLICLTEKQSLLTCQSALFEERNFELVQD